MPTTETNIYKTLFKLQQEIGAVSKDASNPFYKSKYFDINSLIKQLNPLLAKHKLLLVQPIMDNMVTSRIICIDNGGSVDSSLTLPDINDPQKLGSAITYYRRYTLASLLGLQAEDDDGNLASSKSTIVEDRRWLNQNTPEYSKAIEYLKGGGDLELPDDLPVLDDPLLGNYLKLMGIGSLSLTANTLIPLGLLSLIYFIYLDEN